MSLANLRPAACHEKLFLFLLTSGTILAGGEDNNKMRTVPGTTGQSEASGEYCHLIVVLQYCNEGPAAMSDTEEELDKDAVGRAVSSQHTFGMS